MITLILILLTLLVLGLHLFAKRAEYRRPEGGFSPKVIRPIAIAIVIIIASLIQPFTFERVDSGYKGIKINLTGSARGVSRYQYETGWVLYNTWTEQLLEFPTYQQHIEYSDQEVITKGGFIATIKPTFNYSLKEDAIGDMFINLRLTTKEIEQGWLKTAIVGAVNDVANRWEVDKIFNDRENFEYAIMVEANKRVSKWFTISQLRTNIIPPQALQDAINAKTRAIQQAEAEMQQAKTAEAEALKKIAIARGDSAEAVIRASGEAKATQLKQQQLTPLYVEYMKVQKWDGRLPTTSLGSGNGTIVNLK